MNLIKFDTISLFFLVVIIVGLPTIITLAAELYFSKLSLSSSTVYIFLLTLVLALFFYFSTVNSVLVIDGEELKIKHWLYSRTIHSSKVLEINFSNELPKTMRPVLRVNGITLGRIHIGNYLTVSEGKAFFMISSMPVCQLKLEDEIVIISSSEEIHEKIIQWFSEE